MSPPTPSATPETKEKEFKPWNCNCGVCQLVQKRIPSIPWSADREEVLAAVSEVCSRNRLSKESQSFAKKIKDECDDLRLTLIHFKGKCADYEAQLKKLKRRPKDVGRPALDKTTAPAQTPHPDQNQVTKPKEAAEITESTSGAICRGPQTSAVLEGRGESNATATQSRMSDQGIQTDVSETQDPTLVAQLIAKEDEVQRQEDRINTQTAIIAYKDTKIARLNGTVNEQADQIQSHAVEMSGLVDRIDSTHTVMVDESSAILEKERTITHLKAQVSNYVDQKESVETQAIENLSLKTQIERLQQQLSTSKDKDDEIAELSAQLKAKTSILESISGMVDRPRKKPCVKQEEVILID